MKSFQTVLLALFGGAALLGLILFATYRGSNTNENVRITVWGTLPGDNFQRVIDVAKSNGDKSLNIEYVTKNPTTFDNDLIEALASGVAPDAIILPGSSLVRLTDKIYPIPYTVLSVNDFKSTFASIAEIYMQPEGSLALPVSIDPLVMFWNRSIFNQIRKNPPTDWSAVQSLTPLITIKDSNSNITRSAVGLGGFSNVTNAKGSLLAIMMQAGSSMVTKTDQEYFVSFNNANTNNNSDYGSGASAVRFITDFTNPIKTTYTWNSSLTKDKTMFVAGDLGLYFGFVSEYRDILSKNPNLDFDITMIPQKLGIKNEITYGDLTGLAILKSSLNKQSAYNNISRLIQSDTALEWARQTGKSPARRDILMGSTPDPVQDLAYKSSLLAKTWYDPDGAITSQFVKEMIDNVVTGRSSVQEGISRFEDQVSLLLSNK